MMVKVEDLVNKAESKDESAQSVLSQVTGVNFRRNFSTLTKRLQSSVQARREQFTKSETIRVKNIMEQKLIEAKEK